MALNSVYAPGQTPIDADELADLKIQTISTRAQLDEFEQANIARAVSWTLKKRFSRAQIFSIEFLKMVHKKMFGEVWKWAGTFRRTNKNIGVDKSQILSDLRNLLDDGLLWLESGIYPEDEISIRFKHRLVSIHPFPNGNGRHSRLLADIIRSHLFGREPFAWGGSGAKNDHLIRAEYLKALRNADDHQIEPLIRFATGQSGGK